MLRFFRMVERNPCPCSYAQANSDFRFYQTNSENRLERAYNISCFVPLSAMIRDASAISDAYQQVKMDDERKIIFRLIYLFRLVVTIVMKDLS